MRQRVFIAIGSNIGRRQENCEKAIKRLGCAHTTVIKNSSIYETPALGVKDQGDFINQVVIVETELLPRELLKFLKSIETDMGRQENIRWGPRLIDLDIIFYGDKII
ncbi:MAG: 2-amino-4-hydroxy-6-hydroxymethyldihydropteridine diphosphokinase, partial [Deltaproteobacteria bacterium]|nr:2-amino-4-hydroxy-6-hydroxymethyldihydropteridine diphosphokinase [Deltaproteobacteria bacterium]